ncbi:hypothetical protein ACLKA6_004005 [Drosophila palustris]
MDELPTRRQTSLFLTGSKKTDVRAGFARRVHPRPSAGSGEDHTRSVRSKGKQRHLVYEQRVSRPAAWEHQSPVRGPSYRHTDSLPTDPTWRPDLRGVEGILGRRDIVIRFGEGRLEENDATGLGSHSSSSWTNPGFAARSSEPIFRAGTSAYPLTLSPLCPVVPDDLQIFCKQTLAGLRRRPRLEKLRYKTCNTYL